MRKNCLTCRYLAIETTTIDARYGCCKNNEIIGYLKKSQIEQDPFIATKMLKMYNEAKCVNINGI